MDLSSAIAESYDSIRQSARMITNPEPSMARFWFNELVIESDTYRSSFQKVITSSGKPLDRHLDALIKSLEHENSLIIRLAMKIYKTIETAQVAPYLKRQVNSLAIHLKRHQVKGTYIQQHLMDFFDQETLLQLGEKYNSEHETLSRRIHTMDYGG